MKINSRPRRGAVLPFMALMVVPLLAMLAFCVDLAWIVKTQAELQNVADAAALAGATAHRYAPPIWAGGGTSPGAPYGLNRVGAVASRGCTDVLLGKTPSLCGGAQVPGGIRLRCPGG